MKSEISKTFSICMAHRLMNHDGKCANLHGHNYKITLFATGDVFNSVSSFRAPSDDGMVADFQQIKIVADAIDAVFDHSLTLQMDDPIVQLMTDHMYRESVYRNIHTLTAYDYVQLLVTAVAQNQKVNCLLVAPTAENLAAVWLHIANKHNNERITYNKITVRETATCSATVTIKDLYGIPN